MNDTKTICVKERSRDFNSCKNLDDIYSRIVGYYWCICEPIKNGVALSQPDHWRSGSQKKGSAKLRT